MANCRPTASKYWQLQQGDPYGPQNCAAYAGAMGVFFDSCGRYAPSGATIRRWSGEPVPDPASPGLNLFQLSQVMQAHYGFKLDIHMNGNWADVPAASRAGHGVILSVGYDPIRRSAYRGSRVFTGGHALFLAPNLFTYDPLADGRNLGSGVHAFTGPATYPESLLKTAAGRLPLPGGHVPGFGKAWFGILPHTHPLTAPTPPAGKEEPLNATTQKTIGTCTIKAGVSVYADENRTKVLIQNWGGGTNVGLYSRPVKPVEPDGQAALGAIRISIGGVLHVGYVGDDTISGVKLA